MTRPSKLFPEKIYIIANHIWEAQIERTPSDETKPSNDGVPVMTHITIPVGTPVMFLKRKTLQYKTSFNPLSPGAIEKRKMFMFLAQEKVIFIPKSQLSSIHKWVPGKTKTKSIANKH